MQEGGKIVLVLEWVYDEELDRKTVGKQLVDLGKQLKHIKHKVIPCSLTALSHTGRRRGRGPALLKHGDRTKRSSVERLMNMWCA